MESWKLLEVLHFAIHSSGLAADSRKAIDLSRNPLVLSFSYRCSLLQITFVTPYR